MYRVLIVDDEPLALKTLRSLVERDTECVVVAECRNAATATDVICRERPDIVLLDIQMAGGSGFDVIADVGEDAMPPTVFVTAHPAHALDAFDVHAIDYLLKPFTDARFVKSLARAKRRAAERSAAPRLERAEPIRRFLIRTNGRVALVRAVDIDWIEADDYYARLHVGSATYLLRRTLARLESTLDRTQFFRVHKSAIINLDRVLELRSLFKGDYSVVLTDGTELPIARGRRATLEDRLARRR